MRNVVTTLIAVVCGSAIAYGQQGNQMPVRVVVAGTEVTHMGATPGEHVTLGLAGGTADLCPEKGSGWSGFIRREQDNAFGSFFVVPAGKALIVTDFGVGAIKPEGVVWSVGDLLTARMGRHGHFTTLWQTSITLDAATSAATRVWMREHLTSGIVFLAGQRPCMEVGSGLEADRGFAHNSTLTIVHGYLVDVIAQ